MCILSDMGKRWKTKLQTLPRSQGIYWITFVENGSVVFNFLENEQTMNILFYISEED